MNLCQSFLWWYPGWMDWISFKAGISSWVTYFVIGALMGCEEMQRFTAFWKGSKPWFKWRGLNVVLAGKSLLWYGGISMLFGELALCASITKVSWGWFSAQNKVSCIFLKSLSRSRNICPISGSLGLGQKYKPLLMIEIWLSVSCKSDILSTRFSGTTNSILLLFGLLFNGLLTITLDHTPVWVVVGPQWIFYSLCGILQGTCCLTSACKDIVGSCGNLW